MKPRALDLFCGAGGVSRGLDLAGFDVTGVDIVPQPSYPYRFIQGDALEAELGGYDLIWASPPCQAHTTLRGLGKANPGDVDLVDAIRKRLLRQLMTWGTSYVIENVVGAPLRNPRVLCGSMFDLAVRRHRLFESSFLLEPPRPCSCRSRKNIAVYGKAPAHRLPDGVQRARDLDEGRRAMGIDWMQWRELTQAIPPAYAEWIGRCSRRVLA